MNLKLPFHHRVYFFVRKCVRWIVGFRKTPTPLTDPEWERYSEMLAELNSIRARITRLKQRAEEDFFNGGEYEVSKVLICNILALEWTADGAAKLIDREINR